MITKLFLNSLILAFLYSDLVSLDQGATKSQAIDVNDSTGQMVHTDDNPNQLARNKST